MSKEQGNIMAEHTEAILEQAFLEQALLLSPKSRAVLIEGLLASLDRPDITIDDSWAKEAEDRINGYEAGILKAVSAENVAKKYKKREN